MTEKNKGFLNDLSAATQSKRAKLNVNSPWRKGPNCYGRKARESHENYVKRKDPKDE